MSARKAKAKEAILTAATRLLAANPGIPFGEIAGGAGVGRATLYRHYPSREDLIREIALRSIEELDRTIAEATADALTATESFRRMIAAVLPLGDQYHFLSLEWDALRDPQIRGLLERQMSDLGELVEAVKAEGAFAQDLPTAWIVASIDSMIYTSWTSIQNGWIARRDAVDLVLRTIFQGLS